MIFELKTKLQRCTTEFKTLATTNMSINCRKTHICIYTNFTLKHHPWLLVVLRKMLRLDRFKEEDLRTAPTAYGRYHGNYSFPLSCAQARTLLLLIGCHSAVLFDRSSSSLLPNGAVRLIIASQLNCVKLACVLFVYQMFGARGLSS